MHDYLAADEQNVVAVHCKAGKGRTGVMICAYLVYINFYCSPRQNMDYYSIVRTVNNKVSSVVCCESSCKCKFVIKSLSLFMFP